MYFVQITKPINVQYIFNLTPLSPLALSQGDGLQLEYEMKLTNGQSFWTQHFSADEFGKSG